MRSPALATSLDLLGVQVQVEVGDPMAAAYVASLIQAMPPATRRPERTVRLLVQDPHVCHRALYDGDLVICRDMIGPTAIRTLLWYFNQIALETRDYTVLHAGAVAEGGRAVILPAPMDSGKSTLVSALVRQGFGYLSDEFAPVRLSDGRLSPYRSAIGLDSGSFPFFPELRPDVGPDFDDPSHWHVPIAVDRAPDSTDDSVEPVAVVFPSYREGAGCSFRPLIPARAVHRAANEALNFFELGRSAFHALGRLARSASCYTLTFGRLEDACHAVGDLLRSEPS